MSKLSESLCNRKVWYGTTVLEVGYVSPFSQGARVAETCSRNNNRTPRDATPCWKSCKIFKFKQTELKCN